MAIKAIIFDCFGVLVDDSMNLFFETYLSDKPDIVREIKEFDHQSTAGKITFVQLLEKISELTGLDDELVKTFLEKNPANIPLLSYIDKELKQTYKIGFLSNAADDWLDELFTKEQQALFNDFVLSYQHGMNKPNPAIFKLSAERLGVNPADCIFVDDVAPYVDGALKAGMTAIRYSSFDQFKYDIEAVLSKE